MALLVTGGAGYIGSHVVRQLSASGEDVIVYDNLSTGFASALLHDEALLPFDLADTDHLDAVFREHSIEAVLHFAASLIAPESVREPLKYWSNNTANTLRLVQAATRAGVRHFVFSSTAAVYGALPSGEAREDDPTVPINPYGRTKLASEWLLRDACAASELRSVTLRYFNVAGAEPELRLGQRTRGATNLIKVACEVALGARPALEVYGTDYPTTDGTGVRDYLHVEDLASAHLRALAYLRSGGATTVCNVGYGRGASVLEVAEALRVVSGLAVPLTLRPRREGDPARMIANAERARTLLGWTPRFDKLETILEHALAWERSLLSQRAAP